jgi:hypothetical protein
MSIVSDAGSCSNRNAVSGKFPARQINFRIPGDTASGMAAIQLAWIVGNAIQIPVQ